MTATPANSTRRRRRVPMMKRLCFFHWGIAFLLAVLEGLGKL